MMMICGVPAVFYGILWYSGLLTTLDFVPARDGQFQPSPSRPAVYLKLERPQSRRTDPLRPASH